MTYMGEDHPPRSDGIPAFQCGAHIIMVTWLPLQRWMTAIEDNAIRPPLFQKLHAAGRQADGVAKIGNPCRTRFKAVAKGHLGMHQRDRGSCHIAKADRAEFLEPVKRQQAVVFVKVGAPLRIGRRSDIDPWACAPAEMKQSLDMIGVIMSEQDRGQVSGRKPLGEIGQARVDQDSRAAGFNKRRAWTSHEKWIEPCPFTGRTIAPIKRHTARVACPQQA